MPAVIRCKAVYNVGRSPVHCRANTDRQTPTVLSTYCTTVMLGLWEEAGVPGRSNHRLSENTNFPQKGDVTPNGYKITNVKCE